jgi:hypothetical protein
MSFAAGFATSFANTFVGNLKDRQERIQSLVDDGIASAKAVAPRYMQAQGEYKNVLEIGDMLKTRYNVTDEEFVALAQGTDITQLYKSIVQEDTQRTSAGRAGISKEDFINVIDMPDTVLPENVTREQAIAQIMGLQTAALEKEADPKSEGAQVRARGTSLSEFLGYNPNLSAEKQLETMKIMGYDVSDLEYFQATQGLKQKVVPGVTRTRDVLFDDIDYDKSSYEGTRRKFNSMFATRLAGEDISNPDVFRTTTGIAQEDKQAMRDNALEASMAMAKLELDIVNSGAGLGLIGPAARRNLLEGIFSQIGNGTAGVQELQTLIQNIENGTAMSVINSIYNEKGLFTAEDYEAIIKGVKVKPRGEVVVGLTDDDMGLPSVPVEPETGKPEAVDPEAVDPEAVDPEAVEPETEIEKLQAQIDAEQDPIIKRALQNELNQMKSEVVADGSVRETGAAATAQLNIDNAEKRAAAVSNITYSDWEKLTRQERLPEVEKTTDILAEGPEPSMAEKEYTSAAQFIADNQSSILEHLENDGITEESSKEDIKKSLNVFYRANQDDPSISNYIANAPILDIDRIAGVFKP